MTLNDLERRNGCYFALFHKIREQYVTVYVHWAETDYGLCAGQHAVLTEGRLKVRHSS